MLDWVITPTVSVSIDLCVLESGTVLTECELVFSVPFSYFPLQKDVVVVVVVPVLFLLMDKFKCLG